MIPTKVDIKRKNKLIWNIYSLMLFYWAKNMKVTILFLNFKNSLLTKIIIIKIIN